MTRNCILVTSALAAAAAAVLTACGSSGGSGSTEAPSSQASVTSVGAGADPGVAAAAAFADTYLGQPTKIDITTPLPKTPPRGKTVYYIIPSDPNSVRVTNGLKAGASALGWTVKVLIYTAPTTVNGLIQQAVQARADYIGYVAVPSSLLTQGIAAAKAANIPVFQSFDATTPMGPENWLFGNIGGVRDFELRGKINADYVIAQSKGKANVLVENVPAFVVLDTYTKAFKAEFNKNCPSCVFAQNDSAYANITDGSIPNTLISYLRTHPKVNNVVFTTGSFDTGFVQAARAAGLKIGGSDGIQITAHALSPSNQKAILAGDELANVDVNAEYIGWMVMDGMARYSVGASLTPNWNATASPRIITKDSAGAGDPAAAPADYEDQFKTLWKLSS